MRFFKIAILAILLGGCAPVTTSQAKIVEWQRHYEELTGVCEHEARFVPERQNGWTAWVNADPELGAGGLSYGPEVIHYVARAPVEKDLVLHEVCHIRYQHLWLTDMSVEEKHREVEKCMAAYKRRDLD